MFALKDELLDAQVVRAAGAAVYGGADLGECLQAAKDIVGADLDSWHETWHQLAIRTEALADSERDAQRVVTARGAYLRATTYHRTAGVMLAGLPVDPRLRQSNLDQTRTFRAAAALMDHPLEAVTIPYADTTLPGYVMRPAGPDSPRATVVLVGGYDGTCEELYFFNGAAAVQRGYTVVCFDGPGQGAALLQQGLVMRSDFEAVIGPVLDFALQRPEVDPTRIALVGLSLGAHLAPRAAGHDHRVAALIADCGSFDLQASMIDRIPGPLATGYTGNKWWARGALAVILKVLARKPTAGWGLRRGQMVHGISSPLGYLDALADYSLRGHADTITCPTWVCNAENDDIGASAPTLVAALTCPHEFIRFTAAEGAADHCEQAARTLYHARSFAWLDTHMRNAT